MEKRSLSFICMMLAMLLALPAGAAPLITGSQGYTAYLGENNYLYLTDAQGVTKVMQTPVASLNGITDEHLYCTAADSRLIEVQLNGSSSRVVTEDSVVWPDAPYTLQEGMLVPRSADGAELPGISGVEAACAAPEAIYYVTANGLGGYKLMILPLPIADNAAGEVLASTVSKPLSMLASPDAVTIVSDNETVEIVDLTGVVSHLSFPGTGVTHAYVFNNRLVGLSRGEDGRYTVLFNQEHVVFETSIVSATPEPTPVTTAAPTVKPTAKPTAAPEDDGRISKGDTGYSVRKMQRRLLELGYPVGTVDGDFGENTLLAVNLFQCAIGYRNRSYASESMLNKLYGKNAPAYDLYAPLKEGDEGADVKIMQTYLDQLGYNVGQKGIDGKYGVDTKAAVEQFQFVAGLEVTGEADAETLKKLYDENSPIPNATPTPAPTATPKPTQKPTQAPTQEPTQEPTQAPTQEPASPSDL